MKIVLNKCFGGFSISQWAINKLGLTDVEAYRKYRDGQNRDCPELIALIEQYGSDKVSGQCADLQVVELNFNIADFIVDRDGKEEIRLRWG